MAMILTQLSVFCPYKVNAWNPNTPGRSCTSRVTVMVFQWILLQVCWTLKEKQGPSALWLFA